MAMGKRKSEQAPIWIPTSDLPVSPGHPFYARLNAILDEAGFDRFAEEQCRSFYAPVMGRPSLPPGRYFRLLLLGYFEGLDSERGIAWRAAASGIKTPTREALARLDRRRKKRTSNKDWENPSDPDAKITKMKDGRTHLAHKAEHAVDLDSSALVAVTLHGADVGDTTSLVDTAIAAAEQIEAAHATSPTPAELAEIVADKGYHSNQTLIDLEAVAVRSYIAEPERGRRDWTKTPEAQSSVYGNRRRVRGARGKRLLRCRGEYVERSFAHLYDTGGLRRTHLRGHQNILKRLLVHAGAFNLGLLMRKAFGCGTPRGLQGRRFGLGALEIDFGMVIEHLWMAATRLWPISRLRPCVLRTHSTGVLAW